MHRVYFLSKLLSNEKSLLNLYRVLGNDLAIWKLKFDSGFIALKMVGKSFIKDSRALSVMLKVYCHWAKVREIQ